jgi:UDP-N-acetylglucosamine transferase subunit ALG13
MILVTTGTNGPPFDRLLNEIDRVETTEQIMVQHGPSRVRPRAATCVSFLSFDALAELMQSARTVVTHGGVGSILLAAMYGKRPFVVPRLARYGEAIDDHQLSLAHRLDRRGNVTIVEDPTRLPALLEVDVPTVQELGRPDPRLVDELRSYFAAAGAHHT